MLVHQFTEYYARNFPDNPCLTQAGHTTSYGQLNSLANQLANGLVAAGVQPGQRIAIIGENSLEHVLRCSEGPQLGSPRPPSTLAGSSEERNSSKKELTPSVYSDQSGPRSKGRLDLSFGSEHGRRPNHSSQS